MRTGTIIGLGMIGVGLLLIPESFYTGVGELLTDVSNDRKKKRQAEKLERIPEAEVIEYIPAAENKNKEEVLSFS